MFEQVGKAPSTSLPHALRWYNQIASYNAGERKVWPAGASPLTAGGKTTTAPAADDDDDDVDLFGSGDEEEVSNLSSEISIILFINNINLYSSQYLLTGTGYRKNNLN